MWLVLAGFLTLAIKLEPKEIAPRCGEIINKNTEVYLIDGNVKTNTVYYVKYSEKIIKEESLQKEHKIGDKTCIQQTENSSFRIICIAMSVFLFIINFVITIDFLARG